MHTHLSLQEIINAISEQKRPFSFYITNQKIFTQVVETLKPFMLSMVQNDMQGQFLLSKTMLMPMIDSWQLRFHDGGAESNFILCNQQLYCLSLSSNKQLLVEEDTEAFLTVEQQFLTNWDKAKQNLATFNELKTHHRVLSPTDYYNSEWHISHELLTKIKEEHRPVYVLNLQEVENNYKEFVKVLPEYTVYYSIKSNPDIQVLRLLYQLGSFFEAVSYAEIALAFQAGATAKQVLFSAPIKRIHDIQQAYRDGVQFFVADCIMEIDKLAKYAPNSRLILRVKSSDNGAKVKLSSKYGLDSDEVIPLFLYAKEQGLLPYGITFHVGGQNRLKNSWFIMQQQAHDLFAMAQLKGMSLQLLNIGGGFPIQLDEDSPRLNEIGSTLQNSQQLNIDYCAEPGRVIVGNAAKLVCPVVTVAERQDGTWLYIDASIVGVLFMMGVHAFEYPITTDHYHLDVHPYHIASLSCDGRDIIAKNVLLPKGIDENNLLLIHLLGAYSLPVFNVEYAGVSKTEVHYIK